MLTMSRSTIIT